MKVGVYPSQEELEDIKRKGTKVLRTRMVCKNKYETVIGSDGVARDRFLKWKSRVAVVGCSEVKAADLCWSFRVSGTEVGGVDHFVCEDICWDHRRDDIEGTCQA